MNASNRPNPDSRSKPLGSDKAIVVSGLCYQYEGSATLALENVDLEVPKGQCLGLLGPNGAGKTTLLSILTGMLRKQSGEIVIAGRSPREATEIKKLSAIVPQDLAFYPGLTGLENLTFFAGLHGLRGELRRDRLASAIETCRLHEVLNKRAETYSGGIKRRLNLAIGLLNEPDILYLDEPTVGIDAQSRKFILEAIKKLKVGGMTIVYTSHYMEEVQAICDELAIIDQGKVVLQSSLATLLDEQEPLLDVTLVDPPSDQQIAMLASLGHCEVKGKHLRLRLVSADLSFDQLHKQLKAAELNPRQVQYGISRLEDIYLSITKPELRE